MDGHLADSKNGNGNNGLSNFGALRERVNNIDKRLGELVESMITLNTTIHEASKTNWGQLIGFATVICVVLGGLWILVIIPIKDDLKDLRVSTLTAKEEGSRERYVDRELLRLEADIKEKAAKDDLNQIIYEINRRLPTIKGKNN